VNKIRFCKRADCHDVAVGVSRWDPRERPAEDHCRPHYITDVMGEPVLAEVVGPCLITDSITNDGVGRGEVVRLDPRQVNVAALVYAGHVVVKPAPKSRKTAGQSDG
jgi:hypothetical protein